MTPSKQAPPAADHSRTVGRYLEAIFYIDAEGDVVRAAHLAEWLGVAQPTVTLALRRLARDGLTDVSASKAISLTPRGRAAAANIVRKHRIAERWLTDVVGLDWVQADEEAAKLEHALSDDVANRLHVLIGKPDTCPHGNPIPGVRTKRPGRRPLSKLPIGQRSHVRRISEVAEHETPELLRFLATSGLVLGAEVQTVEVSQGAGTQTVRTAGRAVPMAFEVASKVWID
jgi:DtxR family Mn-dependent transcriptional regulator